MPPTAGTLAPDAPGRRQRLRRWFDAGALFKGAEGVLEIAASIGLALDPTFVESVVFRVTAKELLHDPHDRIAAALRHAVEQLGGEAHGFAVAYMLAHGMAKLILAIGLLRGKRWAFPLATAVLVLLAAYQLYRFTHTHSALLPVSAAIDLMVAWLVWREGRARFAAAA
jgi:uncharacterized membrane protein